ncbi:MAG: enoyl-CoA hydratase/isomerase family protein [Rhodospirillaceae bacterium]|jgi:enoyl-CoA hydratase/carnithine racemase|nr:enoyl-CoA hydratase/isomerase family protein [Rhodospirillaceae bacterium]MBT5242609.1 enoyl-CoA hydratase/isomerase family protein [Rhodospirillaceae bacterium]MBT5561362.1 enoyl-CoA hydratase/isomerase family protein [Rhodospirillaceae bacterium]MBT6242001.1 enoyl-CoA hydratase/isomerase family protein [Rhodospirillaceae bacterium]MBT7136703.1 enoyl-CoA hydratase/isomerase family protein [Rhodospirillaceae bacterium]
MTDTVISKCDNGVRSIILNRPDRLNAINPELLKDFLTALREGNADPETRVMVISGAGRAFCAGDDLKEFETQVGTEEETRAYIESIQEITREIVLGNKIVLGAIHGWAVGGGLEWVINCDFAIMAEGTRSFFPEISLGIFVTGAVTTILPKLVGLQKAKELILLGERFDAAQAMDWGLVWKVVPEADLMKETLAMAARIAELPELAVSDLKRVINRACDLDVEAAMKLETDATVRGFLDPSTAERISKFSQ